MPSTPPTATRESYRLGLSLHVAGRVPLFFHPHLFLEEERHLSLLCCSIADTSVLTAWQRCMHDDPCLAQPVPPFAPTLQHVSSLPMLPPPGKSATPRGCLSSCGPPPGTWPKSLPKARRWTPNQVREAGKTFHRPPSTAEASVPVKRRKEVNVNQ